MDMAKKVLKANTPSQSATNLLAGVAEPSETASRLIADVCGWGSPGWTWRLWMNNRFQSFLLLLISTLLLGTGFLNNQFKIAEQKWFQNHQQDTESLVIGRMVKAKRDGIFSAGGLTGQVSGIQQIAADKLQ